MLSIADLSNAEWGKVALWGGVTVLSFIVFIVVVVILRRRYRDTGGPNSNVFDLDELQKMRDRGDIDEAEYKALRTQAIARMLVDTKDMS